MRSGLPHQPVLLAARRQLDRAVAQVGAADHQALIGYRGVVHPRPARADQPPRLAVRRREAREGEQAERRDAGRKIRGRDIDGGQRVGGLALLKGAAGGLGGLQGGRLSVAQLGRLGGEDLLGFVDLRAAELFQPRDFVQRQVGEQGMKRPTSASSVFRQNCQ